MTDTITDNQSTSQLNAFSLASALIFHDRAKLIYLYLALIAPQLSAFYFYEINSLILIVAERFCQLFFLAYITLFWIAAFKKENNRTNTKGVPVYLFTGLLVWLTLLIPFLLQMSPETPALVRNLSFLALIPALFLLYKYFFYFFPILNGITKPSHFLPSALSITADRANLPIRSLIPALGWMSLISSTITALSPDGRSLYAVFLLNLCSGIFWLINCYIALAMALIYWSDKDWHDAGMDPYRSARIAALIISAPKLLTHLLMPKQGLIALLVSLFIWFANILNLESTPPAAEIKIIQSQMISEDEVEIRLHIQDRKYMLRGFQPVNFSLAGETRVPISEKLLSAKLESAEKEAAFILPRTSESLVLILKFKTLRKGENLKNLEDLFLWYRGVRLFRISVN